MNGVAEVISKGKNGEVTFIFRPHAECKKVFLAGEFNRWSDTTHRMLRQKDGTFRKRLTLPPGQYEYKFVVDGEWFVDVDASNHVSNPLGTENSLALIG